jgi:hypothetical protein
MLKLAASSSVLFGAAWRWSSNGAARLHWQLLTMGPAGLL